MDSAVKKARLDANARVGRVVEYPIDHQTNKPMYLSKIYGEYVFGEDQLRENLPKNIYRKLAESYHNASAGIDKETANAVAHAVRIWAMDRGATHFCHVFHPLTHTTAEKHDSFLTFSPNQEQFISGMIAIDAFSGGQLLQSEPDASSFPSGGIRSTFEARGYTIWDVTSPMYLRDAPNGTKTLNIPSLFIGYNGEALDEKTVHLRSAACVSRRATTLLHLLGRTDVKQVVSTLGIEQEFFVVDRDMYHLRPDLVSSGRSLIGALPPKHQQLEDHYFGRLPSSVLSMISEVELELMKLGVPVKTRHNEVAPSQFEMAPIFEPANIAIDHNMLTMDVLSRVSHRHKLKTLFHEKPFKGVNGSGKHCNWSLQTDAGENLLDPTSAPESNLQFLLFLVAVLRGMEQHSGLMRASIASASNDHRLGAQEAPPGIISAFLGAHLSEVLDSIKEGRPMKNDFGTHLETVQLGGRVLALEIASVPKIERDLTDRNRTSPFAFTGNKFEFRAVGSKQSPSFPVTVVNACTSAGLAEITEALIKQKGDKPKPSTEDIMAVLKEFIIKTERVRFEGNGYSEEWKQEAERRGLLNILSSADAFDQLIEEKNLRMLVSEGIFKENEVRSRYEVLLERYVADVLIEVHALQDLLHHSVFPAVMDYKKFLADSIHSFKAIGHAHDYEMELLSAVDTLLRDARDKLKTMAAAVEALHHKDTIKEEAVSCKNDILPQMVAVRASVDKLEQELPDKYWPLPRYRELLNK